MQLGGSSPCQPSRRSSAMMLQVLMESADEQRITAKRARKISESRWEALRPVIQQIYRRTSLVSLMSIMKNEHSFAATAKQYKRRFVRWGLVKNNRKPSRKPRPPARPTPLTLDWRDTVTPKQPRHRRISLPTPRISPGIGSEEATVQKQQAQRYEDLGLCTQPRTHSEALRKTSGRQAETDRKLVSDLRHKDLINPIRCARWSMIHRALLLGTIRGRLIPCLYPQGAYLRHSIDTAHDFSLMRIFEAVSYIERHDCRLEELLLASYLITQNPMTPCCDTSDGVWSKVAFLALGKACSVLEHFSTTAFRSKQATEYASATVSTLFQGDPWSLRYVGVLAEQPLGQYDINVWESKMFEIIESVMQNAWCRPDWHSVRAQEMLSQGDAREAETDSGSEAAFESETECGSESESETEAEVAGEGTRSTRLD